MNDAIGPKIEGTYVSLDVEVLEIKRMLPDVDADDGDQVEERVLVGRSRNFKTLVGRVHSLYAH